MRPVDPLNPRFAVSRLGFGARQIPLPNGHFLSLVPARPQPLTREQVIENLYAANQKGKLSDTVLHETGEWLLENRKTQFHKNSGALKTSVSYWVHHGATRPLFFEKVMPQLLQAQVPQPRVLQHLAGLLLQERLMQDTRPEAILPYRKQKVPLSLPLFLGLSGAASHPKTPLRKQTHLMTLLSTWPQQQALTAEACEVAEAVSVAVAKGLSQQALRLKSDKDVIRWLKLAQTAPYGIAPQTWVAVHQKASCSLQPQVRSQLQETAIVTQNLDSWDQFWEALPQRTQQKAKLHISQALLALPGQLTGHLNQDVRAIAKLMIDRSLCSPGKSQGSVSSLIQALLKRYPLQTLAPGQAMILTHALQALMVPLPNPKQRQALQKQVSPYLEAAFEQSLQTPQHLNTSTGLSLLIYFNPQGANIQRLATVARHHHREGEFYHSVLAHLEELSNLDRDFDPMPWLEAVEKHVKANPDQAISQDPDLQDRIEAFGFEGSGMLIW